MSEFLENSFLVSTQDSLAEGQRNRTKTTLGKNRFVFSQKTHISTGWSLFNPLQSWKREEILTNKSSELPDEIILEDKI